MKKENSNQFPMKIKISFKKLFDKYRDSKDSMGPLQRNRAEEILAMEQEYPKLSEGIDSSEALTKYKEQVDFVLEDFFAEVLGSNEIRIASIPYRLDIFRSSARFESIVGHAGADFQAQLNDFDEDEAYKMGCSIILNAYYGYKVDFRRPFYYNIPDQNGIIRSYKVLYNGDYVDIEKTDKAKEITPEDVSVLIDNFNNIDVWKEMFPPDSWIFKGFVIANMYDATTDVALSNFKANLLTKESKDAHFAEDFETIIQAIFNLPNLKVGYTMFNAEEKTFEQVPFLSGIRSYLLNEAESKDCNAALCEYSYKALFEDHVFYCVSDVARYHKMYPKNPVYKSLHAQKIQSAILTSIVSEGKIFGIMEIVSPVAQALNSINANKLLDIMPYLIDSVKRSKEKMENQLELMIQNECTSIHPSVHWKFKQEAQRVIKNQTIDSQVSFREIVFDEVYPLYGQIDIKGSSTARNEATIKDLILQLKHVQKIIIRINELDPLPVYEQIGFRIKNYLSDIKSNLQVDSEQVVLGFLRNEIIPLYDHLKDKSPALNALIEEYYEIIDDNKGFIYKHRKAYDEAVMQINKKMASLLDKKQIEAQRMYPHYFERFKTDGVEHNLYIGESITKHKSFNKIYLYNLRLWQLQVMCEMENSYYKLKENLSVHLDVSSMILVFNSSLSLRFRMDEKRFDVDGTYNARYEVVKKRVDKANIKGTKERITQPGKITIIYSQAEDEQEYLKYIKFLQFKKFMDEDVEIYELEDLQGVTGLKAIRVSVLYSKKTDKSKEYYTYQDLMNQIQS